MQLQPGTGLPQLAMGGAGCCSAARTSWQHLKAFRLLADWHIILEASSMQFLLGPRSWKFFGYTVELNRRAVVGVLRGFLTCLAHEKGQWVSGQRIRSQMDCHSD